MKKLSSIMGIAAMALGFSNTSIAADNYPSQPITLVVPWSAGGSVDMTARKISSLLAKQGMSVIVENVPGATGTIGLRKVAQSQPNGYTLGLATSSLAGAISQKITPLTMADFTPLVQMTAEQEILLVPSRSTVKTIKDFVVLMKNKPGTSFGTPGAFSINHVYGALLAQAVGTNLVHVPYGGGSKVLTDLVGGQIDAGILKPSEAKALIDSGQVRPIGAFAMVRSELYPNVPTFNENGINLFTHGSLPLISYVVGPKNLPESIKTKLIAELSKVVTSSDYIAFTKEYGMTGDGMKGEALSKTIQSTQKAYDAILPNIKE